MKAQMVITHVQKEKRWASEVQEVTEEEFLDMNHTMKNSLKHLQYVEAANGDILPGDFIRMHCVISFIKVE